MPQLRYGHDSTLQFDSAQGASLLECQAPRGEPLTDLRAAVLEALARPLEFPPLAQALVPGDRVALAVEPDVPQVAELIDAVVRCLMHEGVEPAHISVVCAPGEAEAAARITEVLAPLGDERPTVAVHDAADRGQLAYLSATHEGEPIYLNRVLCDADLVLPIGCARLEPGTGKPSRETGLYPTFSDAKAQQHSRSNGDSDPPNVLWMLGIQCVMQVVPGPGDSALNVLAGDPITVARQGGKLCQAAWSFAIPQRASLVVAAVEGGPAQQSWSHIARAVAAAAEAVADEGAIVICCDLDAPPGPALQLLGKCDDRSTALRRIRKHHLPDATIAEQFAGVLDRARIYLLSRLDEAVVEELGLAAVAQGAEIVRLAGRHESCLLLANAQRVVALVQND